MQLVEIREQAYARAGISSDNSNVPPDVMDRFINAALRKASTTFDPFWLETSETITTVAGEFEFELADLTVPFHKMSRVRDENYRDLVGIGKHELGRHLQYNAQRPLYYTLEEEFLKFAPIPDAAYPISLFYYRLEDPLVDESDEPLLPDQYSDWLICEAGILAATKERDLEMRAALIQERNDWIRNIRDDIRRMKALPRVRTRGRTL